MSTLTIKTDIHSCAGYAIETETRNTIHKITDEEYKVCRKYFNEWNKRDFGKASRRGKLYAGVRDMCGCGDSKEEFKVKDIMQKLYAENIKRHRLNMDDSMSHIFILEKEDKIDYRW